MFYIVSELDSVIIMSTAFLKKTVFLETSK